MNNRIKLALAAPLFALVAACSDNSNVVLSPGKPYTPGGTPQQYTQIERLSRPAVKEVFETFVNHQISNAKEPYDTSDPLFAAIHDTADALRPPANGADYGKFAQGLLFPDEYTVDLSQPGTSKGPLGGSFGYFLSYELGAATGTQPGFGGRAPNDDVIALELATLFGNAAQTYLKTPDDKEENDCLSTQNLSSTTFNGTATTSSFPYLAGPH